MKAEKIAKSIKVPVISGKRPIIVNENGQEAKASVSEIEEIRCNDNQYFITISTKNSIYREIPTGITYDNEKLNGQILKKGVKIDTDKGERTTVKKIKSFDSEKIVIENDESRIVFGKL